MSKNDKIYAKLLADYDKHCLLIAKATSVNIHETAKEKAARIKNLEGDYVRWFTISLTMPNRSVRGFTPSWLS